MPAVLPLLQPEVTLNVAQAHSPHGLSLLAGTQAGPQYTQRSPRGTEDVEEPDIVDTPMHRRMHMWWSAFDTKYMQPVFGGEWLSSHRPAGNALHVAACSQKQCTIMGCFGLGGL